MYNIVTTKGTETHKPQKGKHNEKLQHTYKERDKESDKAGNGLVGEYYTTPSAVEGFVYVTCSVFDYEFENIVATVELSVCLFDRRRSWVAKVEAD